MEYFRTYNSAPEEALSAREPVLKNPSLHGSWATTKTAFELQTLLTGRHAILQRITVAGRPDGRLHDVARNLPYREASRTRWTPEPTDRPTCTGGGAADATYATRPAIHRSSRLHGH